MKKFYILAASVAIFSQAAAQQTTITEWDFNAQATTASLGSGSMALTGGVTNAATPYVAGNPNSGTALSTTNYPAQGTANATAGAIFNASTAGYNGIVITVDLQGNDTASKYAQIQYTVDGTNWVNAGNPILVTTSYVSFSQTISSAADNKASFAFRVVSVTNPYTGSGNYDAVTTGATYAPAGLWNIDNARVRGVAGILAVNENAASKKALVKNTVVENNLIFGATSDVQIFNVNGQVVKATSVKENGTVDVSSLSKGIYIVSGVVNGEKVSQKIMKK